MFHSLVSAPPSKKLDETTAELRKTSLALEKEKAKTDMLLYQMLPRKVAETLKVGQKVGAGKTTGGWVNQAYSRLSTTHGHITDCKLDSVVYAGACV